MNRLGGAERFLCVWLCGACLCMPSMAALAEAQSARTDFRAFSPDDLLAQDRPDEPALGALLHDAALIGVIYPRGRYLLAMETSGLTAAVFVKEGDWVEVGAPLIALEQEIQRLELERLDLLLNDESALSAARERLSMLNERLAVARELFESSGSISRDQLIDLESQIVVLNAEIAQLEVQQAREQLDYQIGAGLLQQRRLTAPVSGFVVQVAVKPGEWVQSGDPILELVDSTENFVRLNLSREHLRSLTLGMPIDLEIEGELHVGELTYMAPVADPASGRVEVKISFDNPDNRILPGYRAKVRLPEPDDD